MLQDLGEVMVVMVMVIWFDQSEGFVWLVMVFVVCLAGYGPVVLLLPHFPLTGVAEFLLCRCFCYCKGVLGGDLI